jgi:Uma2 family endonuclease
MRLNALLWLFIEQHKFGAYYSSDVAYKCFERENYRKPDGSFVSLARQPGGPARGPMLIPPDLAVEVVSPSDRFASVFEKAELHQSVGVKRRWIIDPTGRRVFVYGIDAQPTVLKSGDVLTEPELLPGFSVKVGNLFPPAVASA